MNHSIFFILHQLFYFVKGYYRKLEKMQSQSSWEGGYSPDPHNQAWDQYGNFKFYNLQNYFVLY